MMRLFYWVAAIACLSVVLNGQQQPPSLEFEVASIKPSAPSSPSSAGSLPDGTLVSTNQLIRFIVPSVVGEPVVDIVGLPEWTRREEYDFVAKPPRGATVDQYPQMWRSLLADRMKLVWHLERQERKALSLVVARKDGRLGPQLKPSTLNCGGATGANDPGCGGRATRISMEFGSITMARLAFMLRGQAGEFVIDHTGLEGSYAVALTFLPRGVNPSSPLPDDPPPLETAIQDQLGLKLVATKALLPVLVIDHIERPTPN